MMSIMRDWCSVRIDMLSRSRFYSETDLYNVVDL